MSNEFGDFILFPLADGYPLKRYPLKKWIYEHDYTQSYIAERLGLAPEEFTRKLREHEKFNYWQIKPLVMLMGAEDAFKVIYFPTKKRRKEVWWEVFGQFQSQEELNE